MRTTRIQFLVAHIDFLVVIVTLTRLTRGHANFPSLALYAPTRETGATVPL